MSLITVVNVNQRNLQSGQIVREATRFVKDWMTVSSWETRIEHWNDYLIQMASKIEERQYKKSKQAAKVYTEGMYSLHPFCTRVITNIKEGETPAHEIIDLMGQGHGYFAHSSDVRIRKSSVKYHVGQLFKHKKLKYYGVIVGWDHVCRAPNPWKVSMLGK